MSDDASRSALRPRNSGEKVDLGTIVVTGDQASSVYPEDILGGLSSYCGLVSLKAASVGFQVGEAIFSTYGTGAMVGSIVGSGIGAGLGSVFGPMGTVTGGIIGGAIGAYAGSQFDYEGASSLNYREWEGYNGSY